MPPPNVTPPPIPYVFMRYVFRAWRVSSTGYEADLESPPGSRRPPLARGLRPNGFTHWSATPSPGFAFVWATSISPRISHPSMVHRIALQWSEQTERTLIQQKQFKPDFDSFPGLMAANLFIQFSRRQTMGIQAEHAVPIPDMSFECA